MLDYSKTQVLDAESIFFYFQVFVVKAQKPIMHFLCSETRNYSMNPPSKFLLEVLDLPTVVPVSQSKHSLQADVIALHVRISDIIVIRSCSGRSYSSISGKSTLSRLMSQHYMYIHVIQMSWQHIHT